MKSITLKAPAKINLSLSILKKLPSGYHEVKTIYCQVSLFDTLKIQELRTARHPEFISEPVPNSFRESQIPKQVRNDAKCVGPKIKEVSDDKIEIDCNDKNVPIDKRNLAFKAAMLIKKMAKIKKGVEIIIKKRIPTESGLGGGSSDAAQTLIGLNKLWRLGLNLDELTLLAKKIGMDVCYQLYGGVKLEIQGGKKTGQFIRLKTLPKKALIVLCFPNIAIKSVWAYQNIEYDKIGKDNLAGLVRAINNENLSQIGKNLHNDFELLVFKKYPIIGEIKNLMIKHGALGSLMSGKGSAVFGIFNNLKKAKFVQQSLKREFDKTFLVKPL